MIVNASSLRVGSSILWSDSYISSRKLFFNIFLNNSKLSEIVDSIFKRQKYFLFSKLGLSYISKKIFFYPFNRIDLIIFFNNSFRIRPRFFKFYFKVFFRKVWKILKKARIYVKTSHFKFFFLFTYNHFIRLPLFFKIKGIIRTKLLRILKLNSKLNLVFVVNRKNWFDLKIVSSGITNLFSRRIPLGRIIFTLKKILRSMMKFQEIRGFKYLFAGRFTRRERSVFRWEVISKLPLSSRSANIDYIRIPVFLRYGVCSIHIWVYR